MIIQPGLLACHRVFIRQDSGLFICGGMCRDTLVAFYNCSYLRCSGKSYNHLWDTFFFLAGREFVSLFVFFLTAVGQIYMEICKKIFLLPNDEH